MTLFATTAITGPNGEQVDRNSPVPAHWDRNGAFVLEGIEHGWLVERDVEVPTTPLPPTPGNRLIPPGDRPDVRLQDPYAHLAVGGQATREGTAEAS